MSNSTAPPVARAPGEPEDRQHTRGWVAPAAPPDNAAAQTQAVPNASTPGPHAPERGTHSESTEDMNPLPLAGLPQLPPVPGYNVQQFIGRGGMGIVYQAVHLATGRTVALKLVVPGGSNDRVTRERFDREVRALAALKHPNIVPIYDAGDWHGFPYCAMEFVPGGTLAQHLDRIRADLRSAIQLMVKVARAVAALHAGGVLHRDLKPLNILLSNDDEPMVADFGLAMWADDNSDLTHTGHPIGTRHYMSPEQTFGRRADYSQACDIWGLGVILFELLTGTRPFNDDGTTDAYTRIRFADPPPVASLAPNVPADLEAIALRCLSKRPEDRYPTAAAVADELESWLRGEPVNAAYDAALTRPEPPSKPAPIHNWHRILLTAVGVLLAVLVLIASFRGAGSQQNNPLQKTFAERVAVGERLTLTDATGAPTVSWLQTTGHEVTVKGKDGYHYFSSNGAGVVPLADELWTVPIRLEADVAVSYFTTPQTLGGVYVSRRAWQAENCKHESLVWFGVSPRHDIKQNLRLLAASNGLFWWERNEYGSPCTIEEKRNPWDRIKPEAMRFARVVIEVRPHEINGSVDGLNLKPVTSDWTIAELDRIATGRTGFPPFAFSPPAFGTGVGIFCRNAECVVANLTVTKLDP